MTFFPIVQRELRVAARSRFMYWLRTAGALAALYAVAKVMISQSSNNSAHLGGQLFATLNLFLFASIWLLVPLMTADCISREKREGTLGLLFLTPLSAEGIVLGKLFTHALRAATLFLVVIPVLAVPLLLGGVTDKDLIMALLLDSSALLLALAAGILASAYCKRHERALFLAMCLAAVFAWLMMASHAGFLLRMSTVTGTPLTLGWSPSGFLSLLGSSESYSSHSWLREFQQLVQINAGYLPGYYGRTPSGNLWSHIWATAIPQDQAGWFNFVICLLAVSAILLMLAVVLAARRIEASWQELPPAAWRIAVEQTFTKPRYFQRFFRSRMHGMLERNPIGWLQQRRWSARLMKWSWCLGVLAVECVWVLDFVSATGPGWGWPYEGQHWLGTIILAGLAFSSATSFREDREQGALELILVTPIRSSQIIWGRVIGLWQQFVPAALIMVFAWGCMLDWRNDSESVTQMALGIGAYLTLPFIGLYVSTRVSNSLAAWVWTCVGAFVIPQFALALLTGTIYLAWIGVATIIGVLPSVSMFDVMRFWRYSTHYMGIHSEIFFVVMQLCVAWWAAKRLRKTFDDRSFVLRRA